MLQISESSLHFLPFLFSSALSLSLSIFSSILLYLHQIWKSLFLLTHLSVRQTFPNLHGSSSHQVPHHHHQRFLLAHLTFSHLKVLSCPNVADLLFYFMLMLFFKCTDDVCENLLETLKWFFFRWGFLSIYWCGVFFPSVLGSFCLLLIISLSEVHWLLAVFLICLPKVIMLWLL